MTGIEVLSPLEEILPEPWTETSVKGKQNISEVIRKYGSRLQGFIRKRVRTIEDAEDILQEVYFQLAEADRLMKPIEQISGWLFTVARNRITDQYRKKKAVSVPELSSETNDDPVFTELRELMFDEGKTPEDEYLRSLVWEELEQALKELPAEQREVFELTELRGLPFKEISDQTGIPVNTLISRKRYAILFLRERLQLIYNELLNF